MRKPTEEQKAKAAERRSRMRTLAANISKMSDSERAAMAARLPGVVTIEGRCLSMHNQLMLAFQMGSATVVGGFRQWKKAGRSVKRGQHGASIWIPLGDKVTKDDGSSETMNVEHFGLATVFDISQTEDGAESDARRKEIDREPCTDPGCILL